MAPSRVLIVENERIVQAHLEDLVRGAGHDVAAAVRSHDALEVAERQRPELVLMDVRLANGDDGIETAQVLRERYGCAVVFVTAHGDAETVRRTDAVGAAEVILKPFTNAAVRAAVSGALETVRSGARASDAGAEPARDRSGAAGVTGLSDRPFGVDTRMLVYSHDTFGLGHLRRSLNLVGALKQRFPDLAVKLVTGSPMAHRYPMPRGVEVLKLPSVRKVGPDRYEARSLGVSGEGVARLRRDLLLRTAESYDPDVLLVDHSPTGMNGELLPALRALRERGGCTTILGLRDILDDPERVIPLWRDEGVYDVLRDLYDRIAIYGAPEVYDPIARYRIPADVAAKASFVGYVTGPLTGDETEPPPPAAGARPVVAVSIGGGDGGADTLVVPFLEMLSRHRAEIEFDTEILTGPLVDREVEIDLRARAIGLPVTVRTFLPDPSILFRRADLVVATAGYNTAVELLTHARRAIFIPRALHRQEQNLRAGRLEELGLATSLPAERVTSRRLLIAIQASLRGPEVLREARARRALPLDGRARFAELCAGLRLG